MFFTPYPPSPIRRRPFEFVRGLQRRGHRVTVATIVGSEAEVADAIACHQYADEVVTLPIGRGRRIASAALARLKGEPMQARYDWSQRLADRLHVLVSEKSFDVVHVEHLRGASYGLSLCDRLPVVWDAVDSITRLFEQAASHAPSPLARLMARLELGPTLRYETRLPERFHATVVTSSDDADALVGGSEQVRSRVSVVPNGVDLEAFRPAAVHERDQSVIMTGKLSYHANEAAARWLIEKVMPFVWSERPSVGLVLAGARPTSFLRRAADRQDGRVTITGAVDDLLPFLQSAGVVAAPLVYAVGIQNKVLEAMASGSPIVATPPAVEALSVTLGSECEVAETPHDFAKKVVSLLSDPVRAADMGRAARAYVVSNHHWDRSIIGLETAYSSAIERFTGRASSWM